MKSRAGKRGRPRRDPEERRAGILDAAVPLFAKQGYARTDVQEIADSLGIAKGTVYLYFESKETLLAHLLLEGLGELVGQLQESFAAGEALPAEERLRRLGRAYVCFFDREPQYFRLLMATDRGQFRETVTAEIYQEVLAASVEGLDLVVCAVEQGMSEGTIAVCDARHAAATLWATLNGVLELMGHPLRREMVGIEREAFYEIATEVVIHGLQTIPQG